MPPQRPGHEERAASVTHLLALEAAGTLTTQDKDTVAQAYGRTRKSVDRWMARARENGGHYQRKQRDCTPVTEHMENELIRCCGNIASAHRALTADGVMPLSYSAFHQAVTRAYPPSFLAGLRGGEEARRRYDLHGSNRERGRRNDAWEADHKEADVWVNVNGTARKPWLTLFVNCSNSGICGWAVTPHTPSSQAIIVALHSAVRRGGPHGPFGGIPKLIRVDRGADFLSKAVAHTLQCLNVDRVELPPRRPDLKPYVESTNAAFQSMLFSGLPGYTHCPKPDTAVQSAPPPVEYLLTFEELIDRVAKFVHERNHEHRIRSLGNRTPLQAWKADRTVIHDPPPGALKRSLPLVRNTFTITDTGIHWMGRTYLETWMRDHIGTRVRLRHLPGHLDTVEAYDADTDHYLGTARWTNAAGPHLIRRVKEANRDDAARLKKALQKRPVIIAERLAAERFAATTTPAPPQLLHTLTTEQAHRQLEHTHGPDPRHTPNESLPEPSPSWTNTRRLQPPPADDENLPAPTNSWLTRPTATPDTEPQEQEDSP
ncbi:Mu transposase C-terminal domain-containing protein [Streptomyces sp. NPDC088560]|uniref:Mu transposase C-terminal domain-containing protein n=1 Tax=Streptomyces sp. NPDC088560 TaxID=3365868 RepID=UPI0037FDFC4E